MRLTMRCDLVSRPRARVFFENCAFMKIINSMLPARATADHNDMGRLALEYNKHAREDGFISGSIWQWASLS